MTKKFSKKVLLIEDDPAQSMMYEMEFKKFGYKVLIANTGTEGLDVIMKEKPDLVLLDLLIGASNGLDILKKIKADKKIKETKVVIMSNYKKKGLDEECANSGAIDFWTKCEFLPREIVQKTDNLLK